MYCNLLIKVLSLVTSIKKYVYFRRSVFFISYPKSIVCLKDIRVLYTRNKYVTVMCQVEHLFGTDINETVIMHGEVDRRGCVD